MKKIFFLLTVLILIIAAAILLINRKTEVAALPVPKKQTANVQTAMPAQREIVISSSLLAHIHSKKLTAIATRYSSTIIGILVQESQWVHRGELLVRLDAGDVRRSIRSLEARKRALESELAVLDKRYHSDTVLYKAGGISEERYDSSRLLLESKSSMLAELDANLQTQKRQLPYYEIRAPYDGIVGSINVDIGDLAVPGKELMQLHSKTKIARITYPSTLAIPLGAPVYSQGIRIGSVVLQYTDAPEGLYEVEIALEAGNAFKHGESIPVTVELHRITHCSVPEKALLSIGGTSTVLEERNGTFTPLQVDVLVRNDSYAAVEPCPEHRVAIGSLAELTSLTLQNSTETTERP